MKPNVDRAKELTAQIPGFGKDKSKEAYAEDAERRADGFGSAGHPKGDVSSPRLATVTTGEESAGVQAHHPGTGLQRGETPRNDREEPGATWGPSRPAESSDIPTLRLHDYACAPWTLAMKLEATLR